MRALSIALLLSGCAPTVAGSVLTTTPEPDPEPEVDSGGEDGADGADGADGSDGEDTGTDIIDDLPGGVAAALVSPPGATFVDRITVDLSSSTGEGTVLACIAPPSTTCTPGPVSDNLEISVSGILHARVDIEGIPGEPSAWGFMQVDADVAAFATTLPVVLMTTSDRSVDLEADTPVIFSVFEPDGGNTDLTVPTNAGRARIRIRGSSSSGLDKKNFDLELWKGETDTDRKVPLLGMPEDADWIMHAPSYYDDALIRNALGYALSNDVGRYAPRTQFFEAFLTQGTGPTTMADYIGVYAMVEEIEQGSDRVDVAKLDADDTREPEVTGGYVFKRDRTGSGDTEIWAGRAGGAFSFAAAIIPVDPDSADLERQQLTYLSNELDSMGWALAATDGVDVDSGRHFRDIIDVDSFIDLHILNVLFKNPDAFRLSGYYHKDREGLINAGPMWDLDRTAGSRDWRAQDPTHWDATNITTDTTPVFLYGWYGGLFDHAEFRTAYFARWAELLQGPLAIEAIEAHIDAMELELAAAGPRNNTRWGAAAFDSEVDHVRQWMRTRHDWISTCIATVPDPRTCAGAFAE